MVMPRHGVRHAMRGEALRLFSACCPCHRRDWLLLLGGTWGLLRRCGRFVGAALPHPARTVKAPGCVVLELQPPAQRLVAGIGEACHHARLGDEHHGWLSLSPNGPADDDCMAADAAQAAEAGAVDARSAAKTCIARLEVPPCLPSGVVASSEAALQRVVDLCLLWQRCHT
jgi:hypothetical protein